MNEVYPSSPQDSFHEETLFSCFVGKRVRDASIYVSKKYRSSFYSRAIATIATNVTMLVSVSAMLVSMRQKNIAQVSILGKRVRDASIYASKKYRSSFYS